MTVATLLNAPEFKLGALRIRALAVPSRGSSELAAWRLDLPPYTASGPHSLDKEQIIIVGEGRVTVDIGGDESVAGPGDAIILPIGRTVDVRNDATQPASAIVISAVGFKATAGGQSFHPRWSL